MSYIGKYCVKPMEDLHNLSKIAAISRRGLLTGGLALAGSTLIPASEALAALAKSGKDARTLRFANLHTGEKLNVTYFVNGKYVPEALTQIDHILRDHRNDAVRRIDRDLINLLHALSRKMGSSRPFEVISGYRSPKTNLMLIGMGRGVARRSMHLEGKAIDVRLPGRSLKDLRQAALTLGKGGVGYYPGQFVHLDTGRVRWW